MGKPIHCCAALVLALAASVAAGGCSGPGNTEADAGPASSAAAEAAAPARPAAQRAVPAQLARVEFRVEGMTCGGCVVGTRAALRKLEGVQEADASYENSSAWAIYEPAKVTPERMIAAIGELGYRATVVQS